MRYIAIFDLDETVIDSRHRTPNHPDGTLNLEAYKAQHCAENVAKDTLLPLVRIMRQAYKNGAYVIVLTARDMKDCDYDFLKRHNLPYHKIMSRDQASETHYRMRDGDYKYHWIRSFLNLSQFRNKSVVMFDDAAPVKTRLRKLFPVLCAHRMNAKLVG